ncbi:hypothetical protein MSG28_014595 [Choristoneura fumiferana]|uniref:Uncharacterized protein n=1 Tax=Choristoneura fumiferana TaxID=7141 RepID=A0ACC0JSM1_CHOFU|nr:hypothetical protein MSG28_014595 [Choristoneura fumiferana]
MQLLCQIPLTTGQTHSELWGGAAPVFVLAARAAAPHDQYPFYTLDIKNRWPPLPHFNEHSVESPQVVELGAVGVLFMFQLSLQRTTEYRSDTSDAGVKLLHSPSGCIQCVYLTTPSMQMAFNAVPQFLCIETGIEFNSSIPTVGGTGGPSVKYNVTLFLAEDGNGKSVIVSAGISALIGDDLTWLLDTFKSCNPAWRQVRCVVCDPTKCQQVVRSAFPSSHVTCSVWQASRACARLAGAGEGRRDDAALAPDDVAARCKTYALALLRSEHTPAQLQVLKRGIIGTGAGTLRLWESLTRPGGAVAKVDTWLEPDNYTNILHKGLERLVTKFQTLVRSQMQPDEFVSLFFNVANQLEDERRSFAISRLRDTETLKQSPTDTITQYAYNLMSHQTKIAQKCLDDRAGRRHSSVAICKYGTSTQECSCLFSKVFRLPCRHILMLTTELKAAYDTCPTADDEREASAVLSLGCKRVFACDGRLLAPLDSLVRGGRQADIAERVKTHIPFEPRWTVQHCLFGCESAAPSATQGSGYMEQVVVEAEPAARAPIQTPQQIHQVGGVRQQQYVLAAPPQANQPVSQVIFCGGGVAVSTASPAITSALPLTGAVLAPHHTLHH